MRLTVHVCGLELVDLNLTTEDQDDEIQAYGAATSEATADHTLDLTREPAEDAAYRNRKVGYWNRA